MTDPVEPVTPTPARPSWANGDPPDLQMFTELELFVAGALSTMPPFASFHPREALPFARQALEAIGEWEPTDG